MKDYPRSRRVAELLQHELARLIRDELESPEMGMLTVSAVQLSRDLAHAQVYVTVLDSRLEPSEVLSTLNAAAGRLRHLLAQRVKLRNVPRLRFTYDESVVRGSRLSALIDAAVAADEAKH